MFASYLWRCCSRDFFLRRKLEFNRSLLSYRTVVEEMSVGSSRDQLVCSLMSLRAYESFFAYILSLRPRLAGDWGEVERE